MPSTRNAACTLPFALRTVYSNATTTPKWPNDVSTQGSDWRGRPSSKRTSHSLDFNRRDFSGGSSSSRGTLSSGQKSRRIGTGPHKYTSTGDKDDKPDTDEKKTRVS